MGRQKKKIKKYRKIEKYVTFSCVGSQFVVRSSANISLVLNRIGSRTCDKT
jgi:hypothetical protein